ncbi:hypothetical protein BJ508DRAFT_142561 [Ascobolus immersus RN42]|uniref:Uncharacterized protein n=1 Tax=Ascobolus immersus RN42 TaxID=1160509 RepID=A0A3N4I5K0_ASCIM|nr:hypothetical protein BJ508DRAFT_142561 [Ascobolus immersus RN42]
MRTPCNRTIFPFAAALLLISSFTNGFRYQSEYSGEVQIIPDRFIVVLDERAVCVTESQETPATAAMIESLFSKFYSQLNALNVPYQSLRNMSCISATILQSEAITSGVLKSLEGVKAAQNDFYIYSLQ